MRLKSVVCTHYHAVLLGRAIEHLTMPYMSSCCGAMNMTSAPPSTPRNDIPAKYEVIGTIQNCPPPSFRDGHLDRAPHVSALDDTEVARDRAWNAEAEPAGTYLAASATHVESLLLVLFLL